MSEYRALTKRYVYSSFCLLLVGYLFPLLAFFLTKVEDDPYVFFIALGLLLLFTAVAMSINFITDRYIFDIKSMDQEVDTSQFRQRYLQRHHHLLRLHQITDFLSIMNLLLSPIIFYWVSQPKP